MALRIDGLITSHKDMSNAVSHEIKTPLSRMQFEIEMAQQAQTVSEVKTSLSNIKADINAINDLVSATLNYAILERADFSLNVGVHNLTALLPAITEYIRNDVRPDIQICAELHGDTDNVICDLHLIETVVKNLLYNAARYSKREVCLSFAVQGGINELIVDDDGPGIPEQDRQRVFGSFVQLESTRPNKTGFGLGLAIVKRAIDWHNGQVTISTSPLGGARISAVWPSRSTK
jgi:signal transduction histidine kinase